MATGDFNWFYNRTYSLLPADWFDPADPVVQALVGAIATGCSYVYGLYQQVQDQTRVGTATDGFLDLCAEDYFGYGQFLRRSGELDADYRGRITKELLRKRGTRPAMVSVLTDLTGFAPIIFEPQNPTDTGGYDAPISLAYDTAGAGGYYSDEVPYQCFITAFRPDGVGIPSVAGYDYDNVVSAPGGYDDVSGIGGAFEYVEDSMLQGPVLDQDIRDAINKTKPEGVTVWLQILDGA
jgi:CubicO group peptidase (beta-lactamase class C family)